MLINCRKYDKTYFTGHSIPEASSLLLAKQGMLSQNIEKILNSTEQKDVVTFLDNFITLEIPILMKHTEKDVIDSVQLFANKITTEQNPDFRQQYIEILYKAICPDTGIGQYIKADKLELTAKKLNNNLLNEILANIKKYIK